MSTIPKKQMTITCPECGTEWRDQAPGSVVCPNLKCQFALEVDKHGDTVQYTSAITCSKCGGEWQDELSGDLECPNCGHTFKADPQENIREKQVSNKTIRLIEYLIALSKTSTKVVRDIDQYKHILWLHEIPHEPKHCYTRAWSEEDDRGEDSWVEVRKSNEPRLPKIPENVRPWVKLETLHRRDDIPELNDTIPVEKEERDDETGELFKNVERLNLKDFPEIVSLWNTYLDNQWLPWRELYARYLSIQKVYAQLFRIYQEQQKLGEQYELVCCIGLLTWRTPNDHVSRRHLIAAKASLEFEPHLGKFSVRAAIDGNGIFIELDMLEIEDQPQNTRQLIQEGRESLRDNLWNRAAVDPFLNAVANSLSESGEGQYHGNNFAPTNAPASDKPVVEFAPALILRKRSMRSLEDLLLKMKDQIEAGVSIPREFLDLSESLDKEGGESNEQQGEERADYVPQSSEIYFPLHANEEQRLIIRMLDRQRGVLVQGPPGTGKSHTIANLICHLLATGQRVLVTAKTPRALQVLHDKLPDEIKPLCINLLGSGSEERESLEKSVSSILAKTDQKDQINSNQIIAELEMKIRQNREAKSETDVKLMALRESETFQHSVADGAFTGTAANIARLIKQRETSFEWFKDTIPSEIQIPLTQGEIDNLCVDLLQFDPETERELGLFIPDPDIALPNAELLRNLFRQEREAKEKVDANAGLMDSPEGRALLNSNENDVEQLVNQLGEFTSSLESILNRTMAWVPQAVHEVLTDRDTPWKELLRLSKSYLKKLNDFVTDIDVLDVSIPDGMDRKKLLNDAKVLLPYFEAGGSTGLWIFKSKKIREHGYFIGKVTVDSLDCDKTETLKKLIDFLSSEQILDYIWSLWSGKAKRYIGPIPIQIAEIKELNESLECVISLHGIRNKAAEQINKIRGLSVLSWEDTTVLHNLIELCFTVLTYFKLLAIRITLDQIHSTLISLAARNDTHPITQEICDAFDLRNIDLYCQLIERVRELRAKADRVKRKQSTILKLGVAAPLLANNLALCTEPEEWVKRLKDINNAWGWARAKSWLFDFLNTDAESLERHSRRLDEEIRGNLAQLASVKAWNFCFSRMEQDDRRHLMAWQQAMKRYGKGTGKHAHTHRRNAQQHLKECRDAVPSWIMPLHRVYETVDAAPAVFDVIIVDEASQCGPEALPLLFLGERILVVGDDKQISPEAVGINREQVQRLMRDYLTDFKYADSFDIENSLFAHGRIRFNNRITLREHFRCMPEIIHFSNDLCYRSDPLIPLRQYPPERLEPIKTVYLSSGYREGSGQRVINRSEAEALANTVEQCCKDERYRGMTMGVIGLQGDAQPYLIEEMLLQRIGAEEMEKRRLICGNPYSFQGDERDVIFLSMVSAPNERIGTLTQEADRRRFNVAASRAKDQMWLFHSVTPNHLSTQCFRRRLLDYFHNPQSQISQALGENADELREKALRANRRVERPPSPFGSWFEVDVALDIASRGYRLVPQFKFADKLIDIVIQGAKAQLAVECDGEYWHGRSAELADNERQRKLERCGWHFFRIRESYYYAIRDTALDPLWSLLDKMGILTVGADDYIEPDDQEEKAFEQSDAEDHDLAGEYQEDKDADSDSDIEVDRDKEPYSQSSKSPTGVPLNIHEALRVKQNVLGKVIIEILHNRPNYSCVQEHMTSFILRYWNIITRGEPRKQFANKVDDTLAVMARKGYITIYKAKNVRIKLGWERYPGFD